LGRNVSPPHGFNAADLNSEGTGQLPVLIDNTSQAPNTINPHSSELKDKNRPNLHA